MYLENKKRMQEKKYSKVGGRAWNLVRLVLLWARKGGVFKNRLVMDLRLFPKFIKSLRSSSNDHRRRGAALHYGERELSFDDTPVIHVRMHRPTSMRFKMPHIPCINPHVDFDYDFGCNDQDEDDEAYNNYNYNDDVARKSFLMSADHFHQHELPEADECNSIGDCDVCEETNGPCDEGIDLKAEEFIAKFYQQMKLQRQVSYLQYTEMISRSAN